MHAVRRRATLLFLAGLLIRIATTGAQSPSPDRSAWESGFHVVRPGDTLEGLAARFLGSWQLWRELHALNPWVKDPDLLFPGQRLRIFLERPTPEPSAQIVATSRKVSELPRPAPWRPAGEGDVLIEKDGLRTEKSASARLLFDDGAALNLAEDSLIFIRRQTRASAPTPSKEIEVEVGQADVESAPNASRAGSIEVVVGAARSFGTSEVGKPLKTRSRKSETKTAQFMVFEGTSTVSAAGRKVEVPAGSGTQVAPKAPPAPPEPLLPAPVGLEPPAGGEFDRSAPRLAWRPVPGAASYVVEVCGDAACGLLVERATGVTDASLAPRESLEGTLHWRVTAVAASGLDGYPSPTQPLVAVESVAPPVPVVAITAATGAAPAAGDCVAALSGIEVQAADRSGAALPWELIVNGRVQSVDELLRRPPAGAVEISARARDARGRSSQSTPFQLHLDPAAPWVEIRAATGDVVADDPKPRAKRLDPEPVPTCDSGLEVGSSTASWQAVPCSTTGAAAPLRLPLAGGSAALAVRTPREGTRIGELRLAPGEELRLSVWDAGCGLTAAEARIAPSVHAPDRMLLLVTAEDAAGNRRTLGWRVGG